MTLSTDDPSDQDQAKSHEIYVSIWKTAVDTQMHFNEMSVKAWQFGLTFVAAALGLAVVMLSRGQEFAIVIPLFGGFNLNGTVLMVLASAFALNAVRILDLNVYHKMLRGAVSFGEDFEQTYMRRIFDLQRGMTQAISHFSRFEDAAVTQQDGKYAYSGTIRKNAELKIRRFYNFSICTLLVTGALLFAMTAHFGHPAASATAVSQSRPGTPNGAAANDR